jgi:hypothetical protein
MFTGNCTLDEIPHHAGPLSIEISKDEIMLFRQEFAAGNGLNYAKYDLSVPQEFVEQYIDNATQADADAEISPAENTNMYLRKGSILLP